MPKLTLRAVALLSALLLPTMTQAEDKDKAPAAEASAKPKEASAKPKGAKPESLNDKVSYAYGLMIARQLTDRGMKLNLKEFNKAFKGFVAGEEPLLTEDEMGDAFAENQSIVDAANRAKQRIDDEKNATGEGKVALEAGKKFLEENGKKKGISTTKSGLQYEVMKKGDGEKPKATDQVTVHYHGTLTDGTVFDSSVDRGEPATFGLNQVIPGWTEGVQLMPKGSKYRFFIPYDLAYGSRGSGATIKPYSTLIFEVEYLDAKK